MHDTITIPEGTLVVEVIPGDYTTGMSTPEFLPRLKVHGTVKAGRTYHIEMRRELRRLTDPEEAAEAARLGITVMPDSGGLSYWRMATGTGFPERAKTASGQRARKAWPIVEAVVDRECGTFHFAQPGWEQYSLRLVHIRHYQLARDEVARVQSQLGQLAKAAQQLRDEHQLTDAETVLEVPR